MAFRTVESNRRPSSNSPYYEDKERGWFWYEEPVLDEDVAEPEPLLPEPPPIQEKKAEPEPQNHQKQNRCRPSGFVKT